jgi:hypothetical protein
MSDSFKGTGVWSFIEFDRNKKKDDDDSSSDQASASSKPKQIGYSKDEISMKQPMKDAQKK